MISSHKQSLLLLVVVASLAVAGNGLGHTLARPDLGAYMRSPAFINDHIRVLRSATLVESGAALPYCVATVACATSGQTCAYNGSIVCIGGTECYTPGSSTPTCVDPIPIGQNCSSILAYCAGDSHCEDGVCQITSKFGPGHECTQNDDCDGSLKTNINGPFGTCVNSRCYGIPHGGPCNNIESSYESGCLNSYCDDVTLQCTAYKKAGEPCTEPRQSLLGCNNGFCSPPEISPDGGNCSTTVCNTGSYCGYDDICHPARDVTNAACDTSADCTNGLPCKCDHVTGFGVCSNPVSDYGSYYTSTLDYFNCFLNNCNQLSYIDQCTSCTSQYCAYLNHILNINLNSAAWLQPACAGNGEQANIRETFKQYLDKAGCVNSASTLLKRVSTMLFVVLALSMNLF